MLEEDGYRIVTDPYTGVEGYPPLEAEAHAVYCSHHHFDHDAVDCVKLLPARESPFHVREIQAFHDDQKGALRGPNTIRVFTAGGVSVVHLGDLGHALTAEQLAAEYGVAFLYRDFRPGFREGQRQARELGFYMQKYCGCVFSEEERYAKAIARDMQEPEKHL